MQSKQSGTTEIRCLTTGEGRIVNLNHYESWEVSSHPADGKLFRVCGYLTPRSNAQEIFAGDEEACKAYVRDTLAPQLGIDTNDANFKAAFGKKAPPKKTAPAKTSDEA